MGLIMVGMSHKTATLDLREALALDEAASLEAAYQHMKSQGFADFLLLSTCNRVEAYAYHENPEEGERRIRLWLESLNPGRAAQLKKSLVSAQEDAALWHLMQVAASLESMVLGESQILGQVKQAYETAVKKDSVGALFHGI